MKSHLIHPPAGQPCWLSVSSALFLGAALLMPGRSLANTAESQSAADGSGSSSITGTANWTPATTVSPTNVLAATYDYATATTLRTPANQNAYTVYADSLTINSGGSMGFKGSNVLTIPNLILNGGKIANSATSGNPDMGRLAGSINLTANSSLAANNAGTFLNLLATITNSGNNANLTITAAGTVMFSASNAFTGTIVVNNETASAVLQLGANYGVPSTANVQLNGGSGAGCAIFDLHGFSTAINTLNITSTQPNSGFVTNTAPGTTSVLTLDGNSTVSYGTIADNPGTAGTVAVVQNGAGLVTFNTSETYHGSTTISNGTLALGTSGSINNTPAISIAPGASFDVSQITTYTLAGGTTLNANGTGTPAIIYGQSGGTVSLGGQPLTLTLDPTSFTGDVSHPVLSIPQGILTLSNNSFTVNNASGTPLGAGTYQLVTVASATINQSTTPAYALTVTGSGLTANSTAAIQVSGGNVNLVVTFNGNPAPTFSSLTASQSIPYGTASVTLGGKVHSGSVYPTNGEAITVSIDGNAQATTINDSTGDFSISYSLAGIPASASPYPITYSYNGDALLGPGANSSTALTMSKASPVITGVTPSQAISEGTATVILVGKVSASPVYPPAGETVSVTIDGTPQSTTISDSTGDFTLNYNSANLPGGAYAISYAFAGDTSFAGATNNVTTLTVDTNTITENQTSTDPGGYSSLVSSNNWTPATTVVPTSPAATNYNYITALTLRTPAGAGDYTVFAQSLTINPGGAMGFKGNGLLTISNLVLNGGKVANSATGGNPDMGQLAGTIDLTASSAFTPNNVATSMLDIYSEITNAAGLNPVLTCSGGGTVILSAPNTFNGTVVVAGALVPTILQLGTNNAVPVLAGVTLNGNTGVNSPGVLDLNGFSQTLSNLTFSATAPNFGFVTNSVPGTTGVLALGYGDTTEQLSYGTIAGAVGLTKIGAGTLTLAINTAYTGNTTISDGTLLLGGSGAIPDSAEIIIDSNAVFDVSQTVFDLATNQVLTGGGTVNGSAQVDGTLAPAGTLTINGYLTFDGNLNFSVNTAQAQSNDVVSVINGLPNNTGTGTLTVTNLGPALVAGQTFYLFNQAVPNANNLTLVPPPGVVLTNNLAVDGSVTVLSVHPVPVPHLTAISLSGTSLVISGTNGLAGVPCHVLTTTNLTLPLSQWTALPTGTLSGASFSLTNNVDPNASQSYYILHIP